VDYRVSDANGTPARATYQPEVRGPETSQDLVDTLVCGTPAVFDTVQDVPGLDPGSVRLLDADGNPVLELVVDGEGTWKVDPDTGRVTFTPDGCFVGTVTSVDWEGELADGTPVVGSLSLTYVEEPVDDTPVADDEPAQDEPDEPAKSDSALANTGGPVLGWLLLGLALVGAGGVIVRSRREAERH